LLASTIIPRLANAQAAVNANASDKQVFYESFDSMQSVLDNKGKIAAYANNNPKCEFVKGVKGNAISFEPFTWNLSREPYMVYPLPGDFKQGTIEFWFKPKEGVLNTRWALGLFDEGRLYGTNPSSMGIFWNRYYDKVILEMRDAQRSNIQSWSSQGLGEFSEWHSAAAVWKCNTGQDYMQVYLDGVPGTKETFGDNSATFLPTSPDFWVGSNYYYGDSFSLIDEFKIFNYPKTTEEIKSGHFQIIEQNAPYFTYSYPQDESLILAPGTQVPFLAKTADPNSDSIKTTWFVNDVPVAQGESYNYVSPQKGVNAIKAVVTDGGLSKEKQWGVWVKGDELVLFDNSFYINNNRFLVKGIDYTPWLTGTGPDAKVHKPLPGEYDDVKDKVTRYGVTFVPDYSKDGKIQMWEVIQYDLETMKGTGANTIRIYPAGEWHDKNLDGIVQRSSVPEKDEIVQGDLPNWALDRIVDFSEKNNMKVIVGYWVQEEDFKQGFPNSSVFNCNEADLKVAKDTLSRVVGRYGKSPAVISWAIGNEVNLYQNHSWFTWDMDIPSYLNALYDHVKSIDPMKRPVMYAKYIGENANFRNLKAEIIAPNCYIFSAQELLDSSEFKIDAPAGKAYLLGEYGHRTNQTEGQWDLARQIAGGCFLEYCDVWWKGGDQSSMGIVDGYRKIKPERYGLVSRMYASPGDSN
jgi:hypothetical protein